MPFRRTFGRSSADLERFAATPWGRDLLHLWRPSGRSTTDDGGLRLAVRNGTLCFYRRGRLVTEVGFGPDDQPHLDVNVTYVIGKGGFSPDYARLTTNTLHCWTFNGHLRPYEGPETMSRWVAAAEQRPWREKAFLDDLVTYNPQIIDLAMGLADFKASAAPPLDLVSLEYAAGTLQIAFGEAKMMGNADLRCAELAGQEPNVVGQLREYSAWLGQGTNRADVIQAYRDNCRLLLKLNELARDINPQIGALDPTIEQAAEDVPLTVDDRPRLIIRQRDVDESCAAHGYDIALIEQHAIPVQLVSGASPEAYILQGRA